MQDNLIFDEQDEFKIKTRDIRVVRLLKVLVALASVYTLYFAQTLLVPVVFSALIALLLSPLVTRLKKVHIPRSLSAIVLLTMLVTPVTILGTELIEPIERWMKLVPELTSQVTEQIDELSEAFEEQSLPSAPIQKPVRSGRIFNWFQAKSSNLEQDIQTANEQSLVKQQIKKGGLQLFLSMAAAAPLYLAQIFGSLIFILFLLIFGPPLFSVFVHDFPIVKNKQRTNLLVKSIQQELSKYIVTISMINCGLGLVTTGALAFFGVKDAILWGAIVGLFNFVPYIGTIFSLAVLGIVGVVQFGANVNAMLPAGIFFVLTVIESQIVTPAILGRSMQVNPLVIILWLMMTGWLWGVLGVLLAVPLLVCIKLALEQMQILPHWLKLIESNDDDIRD